MVGRVLGPPRTVRLNGDCTANEKSRFGFQLNALRRFKQLRMEGNPPNRSTKKFVAWITAAIAFARLCGMAMLRVTPPEAASSGYPIANQKPLSCRHARSTR
jgi:hypothetical protein